MNLYLHDSHRQFRFVIQGSLKGLWVHELEGAWITARSILRGREVIVDLSGLTEADEEGVRLLSRMAESGVRLITTSPPESTDLARLVDPPAVHSFCSKRPAHSFWSLLLFWLPGAASQTPSRR